jgi:hypothetical protein
VGLLTKKRRRKGEGSGPPSLPPKTRKGVRVTETKFPLKAWEGPNHYWDQGVKFTPEAREAMKIAYTPKQIDEIEKEGFTIFPSRSGRRTFRVDASGHVHGWDPLNKRIRRVYCISIPNGNLIAQLVTKKLMMDRDENYFVNTSGDG